VDRRVADGRLKPTEVGRGNRADVLDPPFATNRGSLMGTGNPGGSESQLIPVSDAVVMVRRFRDSAPREAIRAWGFGREAIDAVLAQPGCTGIRIYRALNDQKQDQVVIVGIDAGGNDLLPATPSGKGVVAEQGWPCPPVCSAASLLNS
jgi:hypothetical protein